MRTRKEKKKIGIYAIGGFVIFLMIFSVLSLYDPSEQQDTVEFNGYRFYRTNSGWFTRIGNNQVSFFSLPTELENVSIDATVNLNAEKIYVISELTESDTVNAKYAADRVKSTLYYFTQLRIVNACFDESGGEEECPESYPLVSCEDAEAQVLYFKEGNITRSYTDNKCIVIEGSSNTEMERIAERLIYKIHGIMG